MRQDRTRALHSYWDHLRGSRAAPERGEIEPGHVADLLRDMFILAPDRSGSWALRLAGTRLCAFLGREVKEELFDRLWEEADRPDVSQLVASTADDQLPTVAGVDGTTLDGEAVTFEMLLLPLRLQGRTHQRLLGGLFPFNRTPITLQSRVATLSLVSSRTIGPHDEGRRGLLRTPALPPGIPHRRHGHLAILDGGRDGQ